MAESHSRPVSVAHIGVTVPDLDAAVEWYSDIFGLRLVGPPMEIDQSVEHPLRESVVDIFGPDLSEARLAFLSAANGTTLELFAFPDKPYVDPGESFQYRRGGFSHIALVDPDVEGTAKRVVEKGGKQRSDFFSVVPDGPYRGCYLEDPWGNVVEVLSHGHEQIFANLG